MKKGGTPQTASKGIDPSKIFWDDDEYLVGVLGQGFLTSVLQGSLWRGVIVLSNKRLYQRGKMIDLESGKIRSITGSKVVPLCEVSAASFYQTNPIFWLLLALVIGILGVLQIGLIDELRRSGPDDNETLRLIILIISGAFTVGGGTFILMGIVCLIVYGILKERIFVIEYSGGKMATLARWYSMQEIAEFQKKTILQKERVDKA